MKRKLIVIILAAFALLFFGLAACSSETSDAIEKAWTDEIEADIQETDGQSDSSEEKEIDKAKESEDSYKTDLGNPHIWIGGEVIVEEDRIIINGESNLLEGSRIDIWLGLMSRIRTS